MAVMEGCVVRGEKKEEGGARGARYQFSLRGKTVAAPLIDRKILICLTRELLQLREEGGRKETSLKLRLTAAWRSEDKGGWRAERRVGEREEQTRERERKRKKIYRLVAEMPEARRIPLNWNALLGLSDLAGFRRKWAFKCAREPFTTVDISASRPGATGRSSTFRCTDPPPLFFLFLRTPFACVLFIFFFLFEPDSIEFIFWDGEDDRI